MSNAFTIMADHDTSAGAKLVQLAGVIVTISSHFLTLFWLSVRNQHRYPGPQHIRRRIILTLAWGVPAVSLLMGIGDYWQAGLSGDELPAYGAASILATVFQALAIAIFITGISEAFYQYEQLRQLEKEKEELLRLNLMAQYDSLKQQVNPHFLFNSLNSLSALIATDSGRAEQFVEEMSGVYRYLLQSSRDELTTLEAELEFIHSYLHLLKTRFGTALQVNIQVPAVFYPYRIPPLTLQLLVENAVKHNEVSSSHPLTLTIDVVEGNYLRVLNNLQEKRLPSPSEKIGLANIMARYKLLHQPEVVVQHTEKAFIVLLPLIPNDHQRP